MNKIKKLLRAFVKRYQFVYTLYFYAGSLLLRLIGLFVKTDPNLLLFVSYGGKKFDDSPKVLYEYLAGRGWSSDQKMVWAFIDPAQFPDVPNKVKIDTPAYYITALKAGYWITNSSASRGLDFRKKATVNVLFQHGMAGIKTIGEDIKSGNTSFKQLYHELFDYIFIEGKKEIPILEKAWDMDRSRFYQTGLPRNDDLANISETEILGLKDHFGIPHDKKVILYAPTFREYSHDSVGQITLTLPFTKEKWEEKLGDEYVLLVTAHYEVAKLFDNISDGKFVFSAFQYPHVNDLLKISDVLISDYSSVVFDYSILERPIFCYGYDYSRYMAERGFYADLNTLFSHGVIEHEEDMIEAICSMDYLEECRFTKERIKDEYICNYGDAASKAAEVIFGRKN